MAPVSASKQKRLAEKAAKKVAGGDDSTSGTPTGSTFASRNGSSTNTPMTNLSAANSQEDLAITSMAKLSLATDRSAAGVLVSDLKGRDIKIDAYTLSFHGRLLFENAEIQLNYGQRYGLLGQNGSGKSTFLQSIAARDIDIPPHIDIYLVSGEAEPSDVNAIDFIVASAKAKVAKLEAHIEQLSIADDVDELALDAAYEQLEEMDPSTFEAKAGSILHGLGFSANMMKRPTKDMSGGWRMRVALARALFLDEPTNHLDLGAVVWLEAYLSTYNHILVITSHSQDFMDSVCTNIMDLTQKKKMVYYTGNYTTYVRTKQENEVNQMKAYHKQQEEIAHIKKFIASAGTYANLVRQAKSKQKIIDKMEAAGLIEKIEVGKALRFNFEDVKKLPPPIIAFDRVAFSYSGQKKDYLYQDLSFGIDRRCCISLPGALQPVEGTVSKHAALKLAKYSQHSADQLPYDSAPIEYFQSLFSQRFPEIDLQGWRSQLGRFGLSGAHQTAPIQTALGRFAEPRCEFEGGVVIVSHDFRLISQVADHTIKNLTKMDISIMDYKKNLVRQSNAAIEKAKLFSKTARKGKA
ncbi:P-loop containing nucleoside triphosphate hydrolase protein [Mycena amicta]|nr:P-loop containing nucleoside triphosphate hydrolase protein [Mycena amicta]